MSDNRENVCDFAITDAAFRRMALDLGKQFIESQRLQANDGAIAAEKQLWDQTVTLYLSGYPGTNSEPRTVEDAISTANKVIEARRQLFGK